MEIDKIVAKGDMSGDGRIDVSPDGKRLLLSIDMGEESGGKDWDGPLRHSGRSMCNRRRRSGSRRKNSSLDDVWIDDNNILFLSKAAGEKEDSIIECPQTGKI